MGRKAVAVGSTRRSSRVAARSAQMAELQQHEVPATSPPMEISPAKSQPSPRQDIAEQAQQQVPAMSSVGCDSSPAKSQPTPKRTPKRAPKRTPRKAARGRWDEEQLLTSNKSQLIDIDLVKLLANPGAWNCLEEDEKREILGLLPEGTHPTPEPEATPDDPDPKIAPLPQSFIRYSNNWRDGIRQFQLDLQNGRYSDGWLRQAEKARQQRTEGDFDAFKEREFEQFWGQKQKVDYRVLTGESSRVRLKTLVKEGVFLPGDIWKYSYVFGRDSERVHVEKEAKVLEITGSELAFVIPNGQHVFLSSVQHEQYSPETETTKVFKSPMAKEIKTALKGQDQSGSASVVVLSPNPHNQPSNDEGQHKRTAPPPDPQPPAKRKRGRPRKHPIKPGKKPGDDPSIWDIPSSPPALASDKEPGEQSVLDIPSFNEEIAMTEGPTKQQSNPGPDAPKQEDEGEEEDTTPTTKLPQPHETTAHQRGEILVRNISNPSTLATKILKVDGRRSGFRHSNSWQEFRCYRNNQDMGSLWDVRQAWFLSQEKKEKDEEEGENDEVEEWEE